MNTASLLRLLLLAALWGASFLFMRIGAPVLGPVVLIEARVAIAALFLAAVALVVRRATADATPWQQHAIVGLLNSALPFLLLAWASTRATASVLSIVNATAPLFGALITALRLRRGPGGSVMVGLLLGVAGVGLLLLPAAGARAAWSVEAILAAAAAACSYGLASHYAQWAAQRRATDPFTGAHGSMWAATCWLAPAVPFFLPAGPVPMPVTASVLALGVLCTGVAYLLYFRLIRDVGATSALTVTYLIPVFGVLWGALFLDEPVTAPMLAGGLVILAGTALATGLVRLRPPRAP